MFLYPFFLPQVVYKVSTVSTITPHRPYFDRLKVTSRNPRSNQYRLFAEYMVNCGAGVGELFLANYPCYTNPAIKPYYRISFFFGNSVHAHSWLLITGSNWLNSYLPEKALFGQQMTPKQATGSDPIKMFSTPTLHFQETETPARLQSEQNT